MIRSLIILAIIILLIIGSIWWEFSLWDECRADHSVGYCLRVLGK